MGNTDTKRSRTQEHAAVAAAHRRWSSTQSQLSWASQQSVQSVASAQRPWSRACTLGRRRWQPSRDPWADWGSSKTPWPLTLAESLFLPEFPVRSRVQETSFQKVKLLSASGFGSVHLVREKETGKCYAMKVLSKAQIVKEQAIQQCKDEVTIQAVLGRHPFVVPCMHHWQTRKQLFIVTEYVPHGELRLAWKALGGFSEKLVRLLIAELALVLDFLHCAGVIYRDLKMENVLLDEDGHVQLIDFGLARWLSYCGRAHTVCGTMQFMAPEVLGAQPYCHAADWWSLGIMMYTLLVGRYPVEPCRDHVQMKQLVAETSYELPKGFSDPARKVVRKLLCKLPQKRLQSLHQLKWEPFFREVNFDDVLHKRISPKKILESEQNSRKMGPTRKGPAESQEGPVQAKSFGTCQRAHKDLDEEREDSKEEEGRKLSIKRRLRGTFVKSPPLSQSVMVLSPGMDLSDSSSSGERPLDMCEEATEELEQRDAAGSSSKLWETPRWILSLRQDLSERSSLELEERRTPSADDAFSIAYVRETLFKFERVDDCLKDGHHEYLKLVRWKHPVRSMLFFLVTLHSLWSDYLLPLLLLSAIGCLVQSFFMHSSAYAGNTTENDEGKLTIVDSVSKMLKLDMRVSKSFQEASDVFDKIVSLATWRNPKITLCLLAFLLATFFVAEVVGSAGAFRILGTLLLVKAFLVDHAFSRFPRLAAKYDLLSDAWAALPVRPGTSAKCRGKERLAQISR